MTLLFLLLGALFLGVLLYAGKGYWAWVSALAVWLSTWWLTGIGSPLSHGRPQKSKTGQTGIA